MAIQRWIGGEGCEHPARRLSPFLRNRFTIPAKCIRNDFETIAKQCVKQFQASCFSDDEANSTLLS
jgi:hypothetical protein